MVASTSSPAEFTGKCFKCGEVGHRRFECPNKGKSRQQDTSKQPPDTAAGQPQQGNVMFHKAQGAFDQPKPVGICTAAGLDRSLVVSARVGATDCSCLVDILAPPYP